MSNPTSSSKEPPCRFEYLRAGYLYDEYRCATCGQVFDERQLCGERDVCPRLAEAAGAQEDQHAA
jgi:hypothetical protein